MLIEHGASTNASGRNTLTEGRIAWFFLGIDMKKVTTILSVKTIVATDRLHLRGFETVFKGDLKQEKT
ncbi:hypothetical protein llap_13648 [Limosa lapponica baueri]|uniref:Uncharacterized protein n=1 Tax=Limosa lapponica baueri TaxID=1758121 RepID=A0A2I0TQH8_LIMLA|nr:hypothetical protein llap_13648 [Limosa lapponica baueri]